MTQDLATEATTLIRGASLAVAWDASDKRHVYMPDADVAFRGGAITFVGRGYDGAADRVIDGKGLMVMPGLVNIHCHPSSEPMNKGLTVRTGQTNVNRWTDGLLERIESEQSDPSFVVTHTVGLDDGPEMYKVFRDKQDSCIKVVLTT